MLCVGEVAELGELVLNSHELNNYGFAFKLDQSIPLCAISQNQTTAAENDPMAISSKGCAERYGDGSFAENSFDGRHSIPPDPGRQRSNAAGPSHSVLAIQAGRGGRYRRFVCASSDKMSGHQTGVALQTNRLY